MKAIADTGFLVAFANRRDRYFAWAFSLARQINEPLLTCEAVLAEAAFHLNDSALVLRMIDTGLVRPAFSLEKHREELAGLARRFADRSPDLADLCLIRMSELHPDHPVITIDGDFRLYRRNRRETIPIIMPPSGL
jgi:predicted nucleic acid-binding protein